MFGERLQVWRTRLPNQTIGAFLVGEGLVYIVVGQRVWDAGDVKPVVHRRPRSAMI